ncbi:MULTISPECIES: hypothetical protein [Carnobacterium]|uniref:Phage holin n=1 Tax=Carnobacterium antarcticum TaxID=2126436 RepID=A0ABW4NPP6_9LACT|nr:hypothetical protein [Carnobacterium sp. CP1]ALV22520.1 hypothetical protein NY10_1931 [Carnobacterium sp. CP1]
MNKNKIKRVALLAGLYLTANLVTQYFKGQSIDFTSALIGTLIFSVFVTLGILSSKK